MKVYKAILMGLTYCTVAVMFAGSSLPAQEPISLEATLAWIKRVDGELKKPRYASLTLEKLNLADPWPPIVAAEDMVRVRPQGGATLRGTGSRRGASCHAVVRRSAAQFHATERRATLSMPPLQRGPSSRAKA